MANEVRKGRTLVPGDSQTGGSNIYIDRRLKALAPGKRESADGSIYYEYRRNRSDLGDDEYVPLTKAPVKKAVVKKTPVKKSLKMATEADINHLFNGPKETKPIKKVTAPKKAAVKKKAPVKKAIVKKNPVKAAPPKKMITGYILPKDKKWIQGLTNAEIDTHVSVGSCQPKFYTPEAWRKGKRMLDIACNLGLAYPYDFGRGKGKYLSDFTKAEIIAGIIKAKK